MTTRPPSDLEVRDTTDLKALKEAYEPSCVKCDKFNTCFIWREFKQTIGSGYPKIEDSPIKITDLAKICFQYYEKKARDIQESLSE